MDPNDFRKLSPTEQRWVMHDKLLKGESRFITFALELAKVREDLDAHCGNPKAHEGDRVELGVHLTARQKAGASAGIVTTVVTIIVALHEAGVI